MANADLSGLMLLRKASDDERELRKRQEREERRAGKGGFFKSIVNLAALFSPLSPLATAALSVGAKSLAPKAKQVSGKGLTFLSDTREDLNTQIKQSNSQAFQTDLLSSILTPILGGQAKGNFTLPELLKDPKMLTEGKGLFELLGLLDGPKNTFGGQSTVGPK